MPRYPRRGWREGSGWLLRGILPLPAVPGFCFFSCCPVRGCAPYWGRLCVLRRGDLLSRQCAGSIMGLPGLNGRVRDGNGCGPRGIAATVSLRGLVHGKGGRGSRVRVHRKGAKPLGLLVPLG